MCVDLEDPENGRVNVSADAVVGTVAIYMCNEGFTLNGTQTRVCESDGRWSGIEPECEGKILVPYYCFWDELWTTVLYFQKLT